MCGIFGWFTQNSTEKYSLEVFREHLHHRGPDGFNVLTLNKQILLGHSRLAINDLSDLGSQPMKDESNQNVIVFNGEIYNFKYLRDELVKNGINFIGNSDTEVLLKGYGLWGKSILDRLVGMFAFVIWDAKKENLFIARDRMGEKPFYYMELPNGDFAFSSELKPLSMMEGFDNSFDSSSIKEYFSFGYISTNRCIYKNVKKLRPAHYLILKNGQVQEEVEYWKLSKFFNRKQKYDSIDEASEIFVKLLSESIEGQLISDVHLGGLLSGGVDSGIILAEMTKQDKKTKSFCAGFFENVFDESGNAKSIASQIGSKHHTFSIDLPSFEQIIEPMKRCDEPFSDTSMIPTYFLSSYTKEHVTVALSGDGGDELFGGYPTYTADMVYQLFKFIPRVFFRFFEKIISYLPSSHNKVGFDYKIKALFKGLNYPYQEAHESWRRLFFDEEIDKLINDQNNILEYQKKSKLKIGHHFWNDVSDCHYLDQSMYVDLKTWLVDDILFKVDRMSMAHSLEMRAPLLDHRIVEFAASLPIKFKKDIFNSKKILKHTSNKYFGLDYWSKQKKGFNAPMSRWINHYHEEFYEYLTRSDMFDKEEISILIDNHIKKRQDNSFKICCLTSFIAWLESR